MTLFRSDWSKDLFCLSLGQTGPYTLFRVILIFVECACHARAMCVLDSTEFDKHQNGSNAILSLHGDVTNQKN